MNTTKKILRSIKRAYVSFRNGAPFYDRIRRRAFSKRLIKNDLVPPLPDELSAINLLRAGIAALPQEALSGTPAERKWRLFKAELREKVLGEDPRAFLSWEVIRNNMFYRADSYEYKTLRASKEWPRIEHAIAEKESLNKVPYFLHPEASENSVKQAYHLEQFTLRGGTDVRNLDLIIDFGGGYGSMCRFVHALGFRGRYVIFDWPEFSLLQEFYLKMSGIARPILRVSSEESGIYLINDTTLLGTFFSEPSKSLLIATWSLSEMPVALREKLLGIVSPSYYLITYQKCFGEIDNETYFDTLISTIQNVSWIKFPMKYLPLERNRYLIGIRK